MMKPLPPELLARFKAAVGPAGEIARRACRTAWEEDDKGEPVGLLPAPAGEDEARIRYPRFFTGGAVAAPNGSGTIPPGVPPANNTGATGTTDGLPIARHLTELCSSEEMAAKEIAKQSAGRLAYIHQTGEWLAFGPSGWKTVHRTAVEEACAEFAHWNIGTPGKESGDPPKFSPRTTGRKSVGRAVTQLLEPMIGTEFAEWDAVGNLIMMPDGVVIDVFTDMRRKSTPADRLRRRVPVPPASEPEYDQSVFRRVIESLIRDTAEREYLQRRLGAALVNAEGMDDLIWLFGPPGAGKGTLLEALRQAFGDYGRGVPTNELIKGARHASHSAWIARLAGARVLFSDDVPIGHQLEDTVITMLLGSLITAEHKRQDPFDFRLCAPLIVTSNAEPQQATTNVRRLKPIECSPAATEDPAVRAAMSTPAERAACLRWIVVGAFGWRRAGCAVPETIRALARNVAANAPVSLFAEKFQPGERYPSGKVWQTWQEFAQEHRCGTAAKNQTALAALLKSNGWRSGKSNGVRLLIAPDAEKTVPGSGRVGYLIDTHVRENLSRITTWRPDPTRPCPPSELVPPGFLDGAPPTEHDGDGGDHPSGDHPSGDHVSGDHPSGDHPSGEHPSGEPGKQGPAPPTRPAGIREVPPPGQR